MIKSTGFKHEKMTFPCGERHVTITGANGGSFGQLEGYIHLEWEGTDDIIDLLLLVDAMKHAGISLGGIIMPYIPFSRQDRVCNPGEALSLKVFADLINSCNAKLVRVTDPHSDVATALINNCDVIPQHDVFMSVLVPAVDRPESFYLISPDGGSLKKVNTTATKLPVDLVLGVVECSKERDTSTGEIKRTIVHHDDFGGAPCIIMDDICDGGRTFIEIAKVLNAKNAGCVELMVTHGFFTKGLEVFDGLIGDIYTRTGKVK